MWFGEPHPFPERESPIRLSMLEQQSYKRWSCRVRKYHAINPLTAGFFICQPQVLLHVTQSSDQRPIYIY